MVAAAVLEVVACRTPTILAAAMRAPTALHRRHTTPHPKCDRRTALEAPTRTKMCNHDGKWAGIRYLARTAQRTAFRPPSESSPPQASDLDPSEETDRRVSLGCPARQQIHRKYLRFQLLPAADSISHSKDQPRTRLKARTGDIRQAKSRQARVPATQSRPRLQAC